MTNGTHLSAGDRLATLFPDPNAAVPHAPWWRTRRFAAAVAVVLVASVVLAARAFGSSGPAFETAVVGRRSVDAALTGTATVEPVSQATVAFPISGTVASVNVNVGDTVAVGQPLASLDPASLLENVHTKQEALAQAQLALDNAVSGQSSGAGGSGAGSSGSGTGSSGVGRSSSSSSSASQRSFRTGSSATARFVSLQSMSPDPEIANAQQAVINAQHAVDVAIATADNALHTATTMCAAIGNDPNTPPTSQQISACQQALAAVQDAQSDVRAKQNTLVEASNTLDALLQQRANEPPTTTTPPTTTPAPPSTAGASGGTQSAPSGTVTGGGTTPSGAGSRTSGAGSGGGGSGGGGGGGSSPSAADLASDQQAVDAAAADVAVAEQALNQATIGSPIDGTVVAVNLAAGESVDAASSTANVVVQGDGGYEVATTVSVDRVGDVAVGQAASLVPDGGHKELSGKVAYISVVPTTGSDSSSNASSGTPTYLVIVGLDRSDANLRNGSTGTVSIVTGNATSALAVPTSAVTTFGNRHTVEVLDGGDTRRVSVTVGTVGDTWTEIKHGLTAGQQVVLADLSEPLPSSATQSSSTNGTDGFPGRFTFRGGGGFPTGGFRGG